MKKKNITYHDISKATKLGIGTISRYFNNGSISENKKLIIEEYIKKNNYQPNIGAKLIRGYENCVYLIVCSIDELAIINITSSIIESFKNKGINVYIVVSSYNCDEYLETLKKTISRKPKTLILFSPIMNNELRNYINQIEINTCVFGDNSTNKPSIVIDEKQMMFSLTNEIIKDGIYNSIIYFGKDEHDLTTGKERLEGFKKSIKNNSFKNSKYFLVRNNNISDIQHIFHKIDKKKLNQNTIIICGTHTIFRYLLNEKQINSWKYNLTDIGYLNELNDQQKSYKYKLFIDFYKIGYEIFNLSTNKNNIKNLKISNSNIIKNI